MTDKELAQKLKSDAKYFIETFLWVIDQDRKKIPFKFNASQNQYEKDRSKSDLILKARKHGFSTQIEGYWLHACLFARNVNAVTMSHTWDDTVIHLDRVKYFIDTMGGEALRMEVSLDKENQRELFFPDTNSRYWIGTAGSKAFGRGRDITHLHLSEVAHYRDQGVITGIMEACVPTAWKVMETTANGVGETFHTLWEGSKKNPSSPWKRHFFAWHDDERHVSAPLPGGEPQFTKEEEEMRFAVKTKNNSLTDKQIYWYRHKKASMVDGSLMAQEYPSNDREAFLVSGSCIFDRDGLAAQEKKIEEPSWVGFLRDTGTSPEFVVDDSGPLKIFRTPEEKRYFIFADVAKGGDAGDRSVAAVFDRGSKNLAALWAGRVEPVEFGRILYGLGLHYNTAKIAVEVWPGPGIATGAKLVDMGYKNLFRRVAWDGEKRADTSDIGWVTDQRSRYDMLATLQDAIKNKWTVLRSREMLDELYNFIRRGDGRAEARAGMHDDCVIAAAGALHCMKFDPVAEMAGDDRGESPIISQSLVRSRGKAAGARGPLWKNRFAALTR